MKKNEVETKLMHVAVESREDWVNVKGFEIKFYPHPTLVNIFASKEGLIAMTRMNGETYLLNQRKDVNGYLSVSFNFKKENGESGTKNYLAHRVILETFIPKPNETDDWVCDHINDIRHDNNLTNLQWLTRLQNLNKRDEAGSLFKETFIYDRQTDLCTKYISRIEAAKAIGLQTSNLTNAVKSTSVIRNRYIITDFEMDSKDYYYYFKSHDLHKASVTAKKKITKFDKVGK